MTGLLQMTENSFLFLKLVETDFDCGLIDETNYLGLLKANSFLISLWVLKIYFTSRNPLSPVTLKTLETSFVEASLDETA